MSRYLGDLLASLIQLQHTQPADQSSAKSLSSSHSAATTHSNNQSGTETQAEDQSTTKVQLNFRKEFEEVLSRSYQPLIVRELLVLQRAAGSKVSQY